MCNLYEFILLTCETGGVMKFILVVTQSNFTDPITQFKFCRHACTSQFRRLENQSPRPDIIIGYVNFPTTSLVFRSTVNTRHDWSEHSTENHHVNPINYPPSIMFPAYTTNTDQTKASQAQLTCINQTLAWLIIPIQ